MKRNQFLIESVLILVLCTLTFTELGLAQIRIGVTGAHNASANRKAAQQACNSGDLDCTYTELDTALFNSLSPTELRANFDVLLFSFVSNSFLNADWTTRLLPFLELGGGIIWEEPGDWADLDPAVAAVNLLSFNTDWCGVLISTHVSGITDGILEDGQCSNQRPACFANYHVGFTGWHSNLSPFLLAKGTRYLTDGSEVPDENCLPNTVIGLYGEFSGGRIVLTGPDNNYHGHRDYDAPFGRARNQYEMLVNEILWVAPLGDPPPPDDDIFPPDVVITSPNDGDVFEPGSIFTVLAEASDNVGVTSVVFKLDGETKCIETEAPYSCQITIDDTPNASHQVTAQAFDAAGNSTSDSITIFSSSGPDTVPPTVAITSPGDGAVVPRKSTVTAQADASDNVGVAQVVFRLNGVDKCVDGAAPYTCEISIPGKPNTTYLITAEAFDAAGNSSSDSITVTSSGSGP